MTTDLETNLQIIEEFTQRLQVAVIGAEETTEKHVDWVEGPVDATIETANGPLKTLRGQIAEWRLTADQDVASVISGYDAQFTSALAQFNSEFEAYLLTIGFEPAVEYVAGILISRRAQTVVSGGVTYYWVGSLPYTTTGDFGTELSWQIAPIVGGIEVPTFNFSTGGKLLRKTQSVLGLDGEWYFWAGTFPKTIPPASTLESAGGVGQNLFKIASGCPPLRPSLKILVTSIGLTLNDGSFEGGATIVYPQETLVQFLTGRIFKWTGALPKVVDLFSTPASSGGIGIGAWEEIEVSSNQKISFEALRRTYAEAGFTLVPGSFETGGLISTVSDVLLYESDGKAYSYSGVLPHTVLGSSAPSDEPGMWTDRSDNILSIRSISELSSAMAAGSSVRLAFYGDSTTDGFATSGWTANPTSGGEAVGNSNHNITSPNSYPTKLEPILRDMFSNNNIFTFNAGYSGKSLADGWALRNYDAAVTNNPFYGTPTATFIAFGLNDVRPSGSQTSEFRDQLNALINKILSHGTLPILVTCDPIMRNYDVPNAIYNREVLLQLDQVKREVALQRGLPLIEIGEMLRGWANNNSDGYRWFIEQSTDVDLDGDYGSGDDVGLHFKDAGHAIKSQILAKELFPATVTFSGTNQRITSNDARAKCFGNFLLTLNGAAEANSVQGFNFKVDFYDANVAHKPSGVGAPMTTLWVWNDSSECNLIYRGLVGEGWGTNSPNNAVVDPQPPKISVKSMIDGLETTYVPASVGFRYSGFYKPSDVPFSIKGLAYGLNKVEYRCGDFSQYNQGSNSIFFYGFFELIGSQQRDSSERAANVVPANVNLLDCKGFKRTVGLTDTKSMVFLLDVDLPIGCGVSLLNSSTFFGIGSGIPDGFGSVQASVLYRHDATRVRLGVSKISKITGGMINSPLNVAVAPTFTGNRVQLRIEVRREYALNDYGGGNQIIELYNGFDKTPGNLIQTTILPSTTAVPFGFGGQIGGFYAQQTLNSAGGTIVIRMLEAFII